MSRRDVCDRCLRVDVDGIGYPILNISFGYTHGTGPTIVDTGMSICPTCRPVIEGIITDRIMLTDTPEDVKNGTLFTIGPVDDPDPDALHDTSIITRSDYDPAEDDE